MSHTPFILAAFAVAAIVLSWCAIAPLVRKKSVCKDIRRLIQIEDRSRDTDA
jgi:heme exporter protein CcmD